MSDRVAMAVIKRMKPFISGAAILFTLLWSPLAAAQTTTKVLLSLAISVPIVLVGLVAFGALAVLIVRHEQGAARAAGLGEVWRGRSAATASWMAWATAQLASRVGRSMVPLHLGMSILAFMLILVGIGAAIYALSRIPKDGRKKIFGPALAGLVLNSLSIILSVVVVILVEVFNVELFKFKFNWPF